MVILLLQVYNFSTGRLIHKHVLDDEVTAMDHDHTGQLLFCGDAQVVLFTQHLLLQFLGGFFVFFMNVVQLDDVCRDVYIL